MAREFTLRHIGFSRGPAYKTRLVEGNALWTWRDLRDFCKAGRHVLTASFGTRVIRWFAIPALMNEGAGR